MIRQTSGGILGIELENWKQFDSRDPELFEVRDLLDDSGIGTTVRFCEARAGVRRETAHVHLVDDGARPGPLQRSVALPVVGSRIGNDALHGICGVVTFAASRLAAIFFRHDYGATVRIEQQLGRIKPETMIWLEG